MAINNPSLEEMQKKTPSAYTLVAQASKRARELVEGAQPLVDPKDRKPLTVAIDEINSGLITLHHKAELGE